jgi:UDP-N-acetylglucosamine--N-acetylmuramyl-(pentapeptide) pyrophosphoryl-undecaprenol N-acetylglucosamine transferase
MSGKAIETATRQAWTGPVVEIGAEAITLHPLRLPRTLTGLTRAYLNSRRALRNQRPQALLAMGSYSSVAPVLAARRMNIPVVLHEANVIPGQAVAWLSRLATAVAITFPETRNYLSHPRLQLTGLPLRQQMEEAAGQAGADPKLHPFTVLVMGGSQGAQRLNEVVPAALARMKADGLAVSVIHLAGNRNRETVEAAYHAIGIPAIVHGFCADMVPVYRQASLAIARSGANSCLELALFGVPSILVPYPDSARDHQMANARAMALAGAAEVMDQTALTPEALDLIIRSCYLHPDRLGSMRTAAYQRAATGAAQRLAELVEAVATTR